MSKKNNQIKNRGSLVEDDTDLVKFILDNPSIGDASVSKASKVCRDNNLNTEK